MASSPETTWCSQWHHPQGNKVSDILLPPPPLFHRSSFDSRSIRENLCFVEDSALMLQNDTIHQDMKAPLLITHKDMNNRDMDHIKMIQETLGTDDYLLFPQTLELLHVFQACKRSKSHGFAHQLHGLLCRNGLNIHPVVANELIIILVEVGYINNARCVFDRLLYRDECLWNTLITGYISGGDIRSAFMVYERMQEDASVCPNAYTFVALLKACTKIEDIKRGCEIHHQISKKVFLQSDPFIGSTLVDMYMKCGSIPKAQEVFDNLKVRDVVTWTALISGYADHGPSQKALDYLAQMQLEGVSPNASSFACTLKACGNIGDIVKGQEIHTAVVSHGLEMDLSVASCLLDLYEKCGSISTSKEIFDKLPKRDIVLWTSLMAGYVKHGYYEEALTYFYHMQSEGFSPNCATFVCILKAWGSIGDAEKGREIHSDIVRTGLERDLRVGNTLVDMYAKCGFLSEAREMFDKLQDRDAISWNTLIMAYQEEGCNKEASDCFKQMQSEGICPNSTTYIARLKGSCNIGLISKGMEMHAALAKELLVERELVGNALIDMYAKCGLISCAKEVFDTFSVRNVISWTAIIDGYCESGHAKEALVYYEKMQHEGISPNSGTFVCSLKACADIGAISKGIEMHSKVTSMGFLGDIVVNNALIDMYAKCGYLMEAQDVHDKVCVQDVFSWTALISGYANWGYAEEAIRGFEEMQARGLSPNAVTFICILKAYGSLVAVSKVEELYNEISRMGWVESDHRIGNALVGVFIKCGALGKAKEVFDRLSIRDVVSWTTLITGFVENGLYEEALKCYEKMRVENVIPNVITFIFALKACGSLGASYKGKYLHKEIARLGLDKDVLVGSSLVDMYAKYGLLLKAEDVFNRLTVKDIFSWNALIGGYAQLGHCETVFLIFRNMIQQGVEPNLITFLNVLNACNHAGLLQEGQAYYEAMNNKHGLVPALEHNICLIDLFSRAGQLDKAMAIVKKNSDNPSLIIWHTVLSACNKWGNLELAREVFEHLIEWNLSDSAAYVCMSNIYANASI